MLIRTFHHWGYFLSTISESFPLEFFYVFINIPSNAGMLEKSNHFHYSLIWADNQEWQHEGIVEYDVFVWKLSWSHVVAQAKESSVWERSCGIPSYLWCCWNRLHLPNTRIAYWSWSCRNAYRYIWFKLVSFIYQEITYFAFFSFVIRPIAPAASSVTHALPVSSNGGRYRQRKLAVARICWKLYVVNSH